MAGTSAKTAVTLRLDAHDREILDALVYVRSQVEGENQSANDVLLPVVSQFLRDHADDPGVRHALLAAEEARAAHARSA